VGLEIVTHDGNTTKVKHRQPEIQIAIGEVEIPQHLRIDVIEEDTENSHCHSVPHVEVDYVFNEPF
jgi:hypothetical protein